MKPFKGFAYVTSLAARFLESGRPRFKYGLYIFPLIILDWSLNLLNLVGLFFVGKIIMF